MPTITIALGPTVTELQAEPFERVRGVSGQPSQTVSLTAGAGTIVVAATAADWCWRFTEHGPGWAKTRYCTVTGAGTYAALVDVDPGTFTPGVEPASPAWEAIAAVATDTAATASALAVSASATAATAATDAATATVVAASSRSEAATAAANTYRLLAKLGRGVEDVSVLVIGDSTGNETVEWVRLWLGSFAPRFPAYTMIYHLWDATGDAGYDTGSAPAAVTVQTGTGARTLHLWNFAVSGSSTRYCLGSRWVLGVAATNPDLVMVSHGHNESAFGVAAVAAWRGQYLALTESLAEEFPQAAITCVMQNPETANTDQQRRAVIYQQLASSRGYGIIDVQRAFLDTGNYAAYTKVDGVHPTTSFDAPSPDGSALWASVVLAATDPAALSASAIGAPSAQQPSSLSTPGAQLVPNGSFAGFASSVPDSWTAIACTTAKDQRAGWFESANGYAVRVQATGAAQSVLQQDIPQYLSLRGKWVTLAVRMRVAAAQSTTAGRVGLGDGITSALTINTTSARDGFVWQVISMKVSTSAIRVRIYLYGNTSADAAADVTFDSVHLVLGALPRRGI